MSANKATPRSGNYGGASAWSRAHASILPRTEEDRAYAGVCAIFLLTSIAVFVHALATGVI